MTQVKICGLTRAEDVDLACALGAAYVGFVFAEGSPRRLSIDHARALAASVRTGVTRVGVFVDEDYGFIAEAVEAAGLELAQLHRPLREEDPANVGVPILAVARFAAGVARIPPPELLARCRSILFDTAAPERGGGTGTRFDWGLLAGRTFPLPVFMAGGLDPENVRRAIERLRPAAVDVATGVESSPGIKDGEKMRRFFEEVRRADEQ